MSELGRESEKEINFEVHLQSGTKVTTIEIQCMNFVTIHELYTAFMNGNRVAHRRTVVIYRTKILTNKPKLTFKAFHMSIFYCWDARINDKCGQTWTLTSSMRSTI